MTVPQPPPAPGRGETRFALGLFGACLLFHFWAVGVGWESKNLPGVEFRQTQTALSAHFIKLENNFSLAYPTPVLGKPWSIPMEFPLYQWTVVVTGQLTGWGLTKAGRAVSIACFYLCLPAVFLLLARWQVAPGRRWLVLAVVVTCPLYIFYARAFLIETMALMFALWFWVALERAVAGRSLPWLALASVAGAGAGLVKVTTFMLYLLPVGVWAVRRLWRGRADGSWRQELAWLSGVMAVPVIASWWWLHFADATKALNPMADFLNSMAVRDFTLGTWQIRISAENWAKIARIVGEKLTWWPALAGCAVLAGFASRARGREILFCTGGFAAALLCFPVLYAVHDYYYVANTVFLLFAVGLVLVALAESTRPRWLVNLAILTVMGGQVYHYLDYYYPTQRAFSPGGDGLTQSLRALTRPNEYLIIIGQDWNSMLPYYAQRRALMLRDVEERESSRVDPALAALTDEKPGALLITGPWENQTVLLQRIAALGLETKPLCVWHDISVFLPATRRAESLLLLQQQPYHEVDLAPGVEFPPERLTGVWCDVANLSPRYRRMFQAMRPTPVRFWSSFGPGMSMMGGKPAFGGHPVTRLVFQLAAGAYSLRTTVELPVVTYVDMDTSDRTDGVEITLAALGPDEARQVLYTRLLDPLNIRADRGPQPLEIAFYLEQAAEVELFFGPGPKGRDTRDWILLGDLVIE
jgi:hypothetical protein